MSVDAAAQVSAFIFRGPGHIDRSLDPALANQTSDHQIKLEWDTSHLTIKITNDDAPEIAIIHVVLPYEKCSMSVQMFKLSYRIEINQVYNDITLTVNQSLVSRHNYFTDGRARRPSTSLLILAMQ